MIATISSKTASPKTNKPAIPEAQSQDSQITMSSSRPAEEISKALTNLAISSPQPTLEEQKLSGPLTAFHRFPLLPTELRLQIWALALPNSKHLIPVLINTSQVYVKTPSSSTTSTSNLSFILDPVKNPPINPSVYEIGMSGACKESREVYLERNASSLPVVSVSRRGEKKGWKEDMNTEGKVHFRAEDAVVYIHNYSALQRNGRFAAAVKTGAIRDGFLQDIWHLATKSESFFPSVEREAWSGRDGGPSVSLLFHFHSPPSPKSLHFSRGRRLHILDPHLPEPKVMAMCRKQC